MLACVSCIPAAAEYTATIQIQGPGPTFKNNLLFLHVAQLKDMSSLKPFPLSCSRFVEFTAGDVNVVEVAADLHTNLIMPVAHMWL